MWSRACGKELECWRVIGERYFQDADARLNAMRDHDADTQANGGGSGDDPVLAHFGETGPLTSALDSSSGLPFREPTGFIPHVEPKVH
jgi:hypothetical protein